jgi:hypothetical protein
MQRGRFQNLCIIIDEMQRGRLLIPKPLQNLRIIIDEMQSGRLPTS